MSTKQSAIEFPEEAAHSEDALAFQAAGYEIAYTGGGCTVWRRQLGDWTVMISDEDGASHKRSEDNWLVGIYYGPEIEERETFLTDRTTLAIDAAAGAVRRLDDTRQAAEQFSPSEPEVRRMLVMTTGHVCDSTRHWLDTQGQMAAEHGVGEAAPAIHMGATVHGWIVYCYEEEDQFEGLPADLIAIMKKTRSLGCDYAMLDGDAEAIEGLPIYDW